MILFNLFFSLFFAQANCALQLSIDGAIGVGTYDYLRQAEQKSLEKGCQSKLLLINTPGGDLQSTRKMVQIILNSPTPYLCLVYPSGAHAGSAGAIIMQACHVSGAMKATNLGAATPVQATGQEIPEDMKKKIWNDTISWLEGITKERGRNLEFSKEIITEGKAVSALEAEKLGAIDKAVESIDEFLQFAQSKEIKMQNGQVAKLSEQPIEMYDPTFKHQVLQTIADPQFAHLIFLGSIALLYFEFTHPGAIVPGVVGGLGLILSLVSFHKMDVQWGGVALIILGIVFFILELFVPSFGALGIGGIIAFALGGVFMFDSASYYQLPLGQIVLSSLFLGLVMFGIVYMAARTFKLKKTMGLESAIGETAEVVYLKEGSTKEGEVMWRGERWRFQSQEDVKLEETVVITSKKGFQLKVKKS
tara:strand:- start:2095 stop:3351 length:1257 start_codon:yes stop_codon:yes gene_type:complete